MSETQAQMFMDAPLLTEIGDRRAAAERFIDAGRYGEAELGLLYAQGQVAETRALLKTELDAQSDLEAEIWARIGDVYLMSGERTLAARAFRTAADLGTADRDAYVSKAVVAMGVEK